ncbi:MAG: hypothetical protein U0491_03640 [Candidatus Saccharimonadales bacterium]
MDQKHNARPRTKLTKLGKVVVWGTGIGLAASAGLGLAAHNTNKTPDVTFTGVADTYPNPTDGGKEEIRDLIKSPDNKLAEAAKHIDATELADVIAETVHDATGEDARNIQGIKTVEFTFNEHGDIVDATLVGDSTQPQGK